MFINAPAVVIATSAIWRAPNVSFGNPVGNIFKAGLTQICIPKEMSSGRIPILWSILSRATGRQELSALIDASDRLDAGAAEAAGVDLSRLLWVRCGKKRKAGPAERGKKPRFGNTAGRQPERRGAEGFLKPLEQAFKAADILIQNGGLGLIVIDLGDMEERLVQKIPLTTWFRFARVIEKQPTALVVFTTCPVAQSCAALTLHIKNPKICWSTEANIEACTHSNQQIHSSVHSADSQNRGDDQQQAAEETCEADHEGMTHTQFLSGLVYEVELGRARGKGAMLTQSSVASFTAKPAWK
jgi:hypothetical protein